MTRTVPLALLLVLSCGTAVAQTEAPPSFRPTFEVHGRVRMDRLDVREAGRVTVRLVGTDTVRVDRRRNLPDRVESGATYRDAEVWFRLAVSPRLRGRLTADSLLFPRPASPPGFPSPR